MKSYGAKCLTPVAGGELLIQRQIRLLWDAFPGADVTAVTGFLAQKVKRKLPSNVKTIVNNDWGATNVSYSILMGLARIKRNAPVLICFGDLVFSRDALNGFDIRESAILVDSQNSDERKEEVGVTIVDGYVTRFGYGLPLKWGHIALLQPREQRLFIEACAQPNRHKYFAFEILNEVLEQGGSMRGVTNEHMRLVEVDTAADAKRAVDIL